MGASQNIVLGRADVSIGAWVTNGGAGSLTALGHTSGPVSLETTWDNFRVESEQQLGALAAEPTKVTHKLKFSMLESLLENWRIALRQLAAQKTGTTPNFILALADPSVQYWQIQLVGKPIRSALSALGPNPGSRTITAWRAALESTDAIQLTKDSPQILVCTFDLMYDESIAAPTTAGNYLKVVDTSVG